MMPLGSHSVGGVGGRSSSSSNLSPLAPPFTFDKPYQKQPNSNPPLNFTEPPYSPQFDRPRPVWSPSNFIENSSRNGKFSSEVRGFPGSQPNCLQTDPLTSLKSVASDGYDRFSHGRYTNSVPTSLVDAKPYYPPYVAVVDRDSVACNQLSYDLLSNFVPGKLSVSSQVDDTRMTSSVKYDPERSALWNGLSNVEQCNSLGLGVSLGPQDYKPSGSSMGQKCMKKVGSLESYVETSAQSKNCFGGFGGETNFGSRSIEDRKSFKEQNSGSATGRCIGRPAMGSTSPCNKNHHLQDLFPQAPHPKYFGVYEPPLDSQNKHANYTDSYFLDSPSTMRPSPANQTKMTFGGFPSPQDAVHSKTVNSTNSKAIDKIETASDFVPYHPFGLNCQERSYTGKADSFLTTSSSAKMDDNIKKKHLNDDCFDQLSKTKSVTPNPHLSVTDRVKMNSDTDTTVTFFSKEISSDGPEIQNPAVDSPCWKRALATCFCPVEDSKLVSPDDIVEKLEARFKVDSEEHKQSPTGPDTTDNIHVSPEVIEKNSSNKFSDANYVSKECDDSFATKQSCHSMELYDGQGFGSLDKKNQLNLDIGNELCLLNYSGIASSSKSPQTLQTNSEDCEVVPKEKLAVKVVASVAELKGKCIVPPTSRGLSCAPTNVADHLLHSPSENVMKAFSEVDTSVLLNAMKTLSQVLVDHCLKSDATSTELDIAALKHIISNLNCCLVKEADEITQTEKALDPQQGTSYCEDALQSQMVRKVTTAHTEPLGLDIVGDEKHDIFTKRNEGLLDSSFVKDDVEIVGDADTVQAIKRVLDMKFPSEELQPETVLYKNLWLDAEAALCATTVKSRFKRLKIDMEKRECLRTNDEENARIPKASCVNDVTELSHEAKDSLNPSKHSYSTDMESSVLARFCTLGSVVKDLKPLNSEVNYIPLPPLDFLGVAPQSNANDSEASVMARLQILKSRADNIESLDTGDEKSPSKNSEPVYSNHSFQDSYFASIASHKDDVEASVMSRFNILKSRTEHPPSLLHMDTHQLPGQVDGLDVQCKGESVKYSLGASMSFNPGNDKPYKVNALGDELLEEWEHVIKDAFPKRTYCI